MAAGGSCQPFLLLKSVRQKASRMNTRTLLSAIENVRKQITHDENILIMLHQRSSLGVPQNVQLCSLSLKGSGGDREGSLFINSIYLFFQ